MAMSVGSGELALDQVVSRQQVLLLFVGRLQAT